MKNNKNQSAILQHVSLNSAAVFWFCEKLPASCCPAILLFEKKKQLITQLDDN